MKRIGIILILSSIIFVMSFAEAPTNLSANYKGEKMWNTQKMIPYCGSVSLEIKDSIAYLKQNSNERIDTFVYHDIHNHSFRYIRKKNAFSWEYLCLSNDSSQLQVGEPMEVNYFYRLVSINSSTICPKCLGTGEVLCPRCQGTGHVTPKKNGSPEESVGICPFCHGSRSITHSPCRRCKGTGWVEVRKYK